MDTFKPIWTSLKSKKKQELADRLETTKSYLSQIACGARSPGKHFKRSLESEIKILAENMEVNT